MTCSKRNSPAYESGPSQRLLPHVVSLIFLNVTRRISLEYVYCSSLSTLRFSTDDGDGSENVIKHEVAFFQTFRVYFSSLEKLKVLGEFPWSRFLGDRTEVQKEKEKFVVACLYVFHKT